MLNGDLVLQEDGLGNGDGDITTYDEHYKRMNNSESSMIDGKRMSLPRESKLDHGMMAQKQLIILDNENGRQLVS